MSKVPHTVLEPYFSGKPVVIKTTVIFEVGSPISDLTGVTLTARIWRDNGVHIDASIAVDGDNVTVTFPGTNLIAGSWVGQLGHSNDMLATFEFEVTKTQ